MLRDKSEHLQTALKSRKTPQQMVFVTDKVRKDTFWNFRLNAMSDRLLSHRTDDKLFHMYSEPNDGSQKSKWVAAVTATLLNRS